MQFCVDCGGALNLFETNDDGLCPSCWRKKEQSLPAKQTQMPADLDETTLSCVDGRIILTAKEGWVLWSCPSTEQTRLTTLVEQARRIYTIRKKRLKK